MAAVTQWTELMVNTSVTPFVPLLSTAVTVTNIDNSVATCYSDITGATALGSNVVNTDASGNLTLFVSPVGSDRTGRYKVTPSGLGTVIIQVGESANGGMIAGDISFRSGRPRVDVDACGGGTGVTDNSSAIAAAETLLTTLGGGILAFGPGTYNASARAHPDGGYAMLITPPNVQVVGAARGATVVKLIASQPSGTVLVENRNASAGGDENIGFADITLDGNAVNQTQLIEGFDMFRARTLDFTRVTVTNVRGTAGAPPNETFHFEVVYCADVNFVDCAAVGTSGATATGFSADASTNVTYVACTARGMGNAHGFTHNNCRNLTYTACRSYLNAGIGFNSESSRDIVYNACTAGGAAAAAAGYPFTSGQSMGNTGNGFVINATTAFQINGCTSSNNGGHGIFTTGTVGGQISGGVYRANGGYGISLSGTSEQTVTFAGIPQTSGNAFAGYNFTTAGAITNLPGRIQGSQIPAVPATNVAATNNLPFNVDIYIIGGTYTAVYIDGAVNLGAVGYVRLRPQQQIIITYTAAPTWLWEITG